MPPGEPGIYRLTQELIISAADGGRNGRHWHCGPCGEHLEIIDACAERDADRAEAAASAHFQAALQRVLGTF